MTRQGHMTRSLSMPMHRRELRVVGDAHMWADPQILKGLMVINDCLYGAGYIVGYINVASDGVVAKKKTLLKHLCYYN